MLRISSQFHYSHKKTTTTTKQNLDPRAVARRANESKIVESGKIDEKVVKFCNCITDVALKLKVCFRKARYLKTDS
jgi:hypothetical protein